MADEPHTMTQPEVLRMLKPWAFVDQVDLLTAVLAQLRDELRHLDYEDDEDEDQRELDQLAADHLQGARDEVDEARDNLIRNGWQQE
jgi:hypothetical protein